MLARDVVIFSASERITYVDFIFQITFIKMWIGINIRGPILNFCANNFSSNRRIGVLLHDEIRVTKIPRVTSHELLRLFSVRL